MANVKLSQSRAVAVFAHCGFGTAGRWTIERLNEKIEDIAEVADAKDAPEDEQTAKDLLDVLAAIESADSITIVADEEPGGADDAEPSKGKSKSKAKPKKEEVDKEEEADKAEEEEAPANAKEGRSKKDKPANESKAKGSYTVRYKETRYYYAAKVLKDNPDALKNGVITPEMVQEVNKRYGRVNDTTSTSALCAAAQAIYSYLERDDENE